MEATSALKMLPIPGSVFWYTSSRSMDALLCHTSYNRCTGHQSEEFAMEGCTL